MAEYNINPFGDKPVPEGYPIYDGLDSDSAQQALSARQGKRLKEMLDEFQLDAVLGVRTSPTRQLTLTTSGTTKVAQYPLYKGSLVHVKVTLGTTVSGKTHLIGKVDSTSTGQKILATVESGETTVEADIEVDKKYNYLALWNVNDTSLASNNITVEVSHKCNVTGNDNLANVIPIEYNSQYKNWKSSVIRLPVKKGNVLYFYGYGPSPASIAVFKTSYYGTTVWSVGNSSGYTAEANEGFVTFEDDGYVIVQSYAADLTPLFILFSNERFKDEIVVAAANAPESSKYKADYFCTGTNDEVLLNELINGALILQKRLRIMQGDYWLDAPTQQYDAANDTFLLVNTNPLASGDPNRMLVMLGEDTFHKPVFHISDSSYEALDSSKQYRFIGIKNSSVYGGSVELGNFRIRYPANQKKIRAIDMFDFGGYAELYNLNLYAITSGYNGVIYDMYHPCAPAVEGCIGVLFVAKGPNGSGSMTNCHASGFNEGFCLNTEWARITNCGATHCVTGWVFGRYGRPMHNVTSASQHPMQLFMCGDERNVNLPKFYYNDGLENIEMYAFSIERFSNGNVPGGQLGNLAMVVGDDTEGKFRGVIRYSTYGGGSANAVNIGFWEFGHGHGMKTVDASHAQAGNTTLRNTYRPNFMQRYFDTSLGTNGKEIICVDESGNNGKGTWVDAAGNIV